VRFNCRAKGAGMRMARLLPHFLSAGMGVLLEK
jgi:hypothetical protein